MPAFKDLTGRRFTRWTVLSRGECPQGLEKRVYWNCICDCGKSAVVSGQVLAGQKSKSCGCLKLEVSSHSCKVRRHGARMDLTGSESGYLTYVKELPDRPGPSHVRRIECLCACGKTVSVSASEYIAGNVRSCGCFMREIKRQQMRDLRARQLRKSKCASP